MKLDKFIDKQKREYIEELNKYSKKDLIEKIIQERERYGDTNGEHYEVVQRLNDEIRRVKAKAFDALMKTSR